MWILVQKSSLIRGQEVLQAWCGYCQGCRAGLVPGLCRRRELFAPRAVWCWVSSHLLMLPAHCAPEPKELRALHMASGSQKEVHLVACYMFCDFHTCSNYLGVLICVFCIE